MKINSFKTLLASLLFVTSFVLHAQTDVHVEKDSTSLNAQLSLEAEHIETMCLVSKSLGRNKYKYLYNYFTPFEQTLLMIEGYAEKDVNNMMQQNPEMPFEIIRDSWNDKWSKVYCPITSDGTDGYLDFHLIHSSQFQTVRNLYDPNWKIKAEVNRIVSFYGVKSSTEYPHTLADLVSTMLEKKMGQVAYSSGLEKEIRNFYTELRKFGAKKVSELSEKELKLLIKHSTNVPENK